MMESGHSDAIALGPGEGEAVGSSVIKADRPELALFEFEIAPGGGAALHLHRLHSDSFYVLEGELEFRVGEETFARPPVCTSWLLRVFLTLSGTRAPCRHEP